MLRFLLLTRNNDNLKVPMPYKLQAKIHGPKILKVKIEKITLKGKVKCND